ncbi:MAG: type II toxin-antitoxin system PemK/MazF family toxin [Gemmatimonas sp.]
MGVVTPDRVRRGDVFLVHLDLTLGGEIQNSRPCVVVSPDDLNAHVRTVIVSAADERWTRVSVSRLLQIWR